MRMRFASLCLATLIPFADVSGSAQGPGTITTYAGNGYGAPNSGGFSGDNGPATAAELFTPFQLALDAAGNLYIADLNNYCIRKVTASTGVITTAAGVCGSSGSSANGVAATSADLVSPTSVAVDHSGNLYICDSGDNRIRKVTAATGIMTTVAGNGTNGYFGDGGPATSAQLGHPEGIGLDSSGNLYIDDASNDRIRKVANSSGIISTVAGTGFSGYSGDGGLATAATVDSPAGLAVTAAGDFYFLDQNSAIVRRVAASNGIISTVAGNNTWGFSGDGGPATKAAIYDASGVGVDSAENLYIADTFNQRIRKVDVSTGIITTVAGDGQQGYAGDGGPALNAGLRIPSGIAVSSTGDLYIADSNNNRIRKVRAGGKAQSFISLPLPYFPQLYGRSIDLTAKVTGIPGLPLPTGTVTFYERTTKLDTASLDSAGLASFSTDSFSVGSHPITASYSGDAYYAPSSALDGFNFPLTIVAFAAAPPAFSRRSGVHNLNLQVTLTDSSPGVTIFFTTDGSNPVPPNVTTTGVVLSAGNAKQYTGSITVETAETIKAIAVGGQYAMGPTSSASYVIDLPYEAPLQQGQWAWENGADNVSLSPMQPCGHGPGSTGMPGVYGQPGVPAVTNTPGGRRSSVKWTDSHGAFWLFGGFGVDAAAQCAELNDLWKFDPLTSEWTWMSGSSAPPNLTVGGVYGTIGQFSPANTPGSRELAMTWTDKAGHLWLFGGYGYDATNAAGDLNDLWEFDPGMHQWAWMAGSKFRNQSGTYGTLQASGAGAAPGARWGAVSWVDNEGALWLFGGSGYDTNGNSDLLNDLWRFDPNTQQWAWMGGGKTVNQHGIYGRLNVGSTTNIPGAREGDVAWADPGDHVWLFGGLGKSGQGSSAGMLNDIWKFDVKTLVWTWVGGLSTPGTHQGPQWTGESGVYGTQGVPAPGNIPGSRVSPAIWTDGEGNFWLLGGSGFDSLGNYGILNDLWEYVPAKKLWAWMGGGFAAPSSQPLLGKYGQFRVPSPGNSPGSRLPAAGWTDRSGNLWLFGGEGYDAVGVDGLLNDLWKYGLPTKKQ